MTAGAIIMMARVIIIIAIYWTFPILPGNANNQIRKLFGKKEIKRNFLIAMAIFPAKFNHNVH